MALPIASVDQVEKNRQSYWALFVFILAAVAIYFLRRLNSEAAITSLFGFAFGYILQRSRFCFAAGFRDIFMIRNTALSRAILLLILLTSFGFFAVYLSGFGKGLLPESGIIYPLGLHTVAGGLLFGFGLVIAGNCVSGCLMRMGEGYLMQWFTFIGLLFGSALGAWNLAWWGPFSIEAAPIVFIPDYLGWPGTLFAYGLFIALFYLLALIYERGSVKAIRLPALDFKLLADGTKDTFKMLFSGYNWSYSLGAIALSLTNIALFYLWGKPAGITSGITHLAGRLSCQIGFFPCDWYYFKELIYLESRRIYLEHPLLYLSGAIVVVSFFASLLHREFRVRKPGSVKFIYTALVGGTLLGYSSRIAMGCNFGGFWGGASSFSLHAWVFGFFILIGAYLGGKFFMRYLL
ncbi:MAG: YeeE/YedE family protein [Dethiobacteria bacterium]|nr:YeeE/YedE family protein [Dethiobacteria bacterium]